MGVSSFVEPFSIRPKKLRDHLFAPFQKESRYSGIERLFTPIKVVRNATTVEKTGRT